MKKSLLGIALAASFAAEPAAAAPVTFTVGTLGGSLSTAITPINGGSFDLNLGAVGTSATIDLFNIRATETIGFDDVFPGLLTIDFDGLFDTTVLGAFGGEPFSSRGYTLFLDRTDVAFGNGGLMSINVLNTDFGRSSASTVRATFTVTRAAVPEPAALGLLGLGILGIAAGRRRAA